MTFAPGLIALRPGEGTRLEAFGNVHINKVVDSDTGAVAGRWSSSTSRAQIHLSTSTNMRTKPSTCCKAVCASWSGMRQSTAKQAVSCSRLGACPTPSLGSLAKTSRCC